NRADLSLLRSASAPSNAQAIRTALPFEVPEPARPVLPFAAQEAAPQATTMPGGMPARAALPFEARAAVAPEASRAAPAPAAPRASSGGKTLLGGTPARSVLPFLDG